MNTDYGIFTLRGKNAIGDQLTKDLERFREHKRFNRDRKKNFRQLYILMYTPYLSAYKT
jgi:hypothetical protein